MVYVLTFGPGMIINMLLYFCLCSNEICSVFNLWSVLLSEMRKVSCLKANFAQVLASKMISHIAIMIDDVQFLTGKVIIIDTNVFCWSCVAYTATYMY